MIILSSSDEENNHLISSDESLKIIRKKKKKKQRIISSSSDETDQINNESVSFETRVNNENEFDKDSIVIPECDSEKPKSNESVLSHEFLRDEETISDCSISSFEMQMEDCTFQVRLKSMNKFTVSGLKVNCSLKQLKSC